MTNYSDVFEKIYVDNGFGGTEETRKETRSGPGSTLEATKDVRRFIMYVVNKYDIKSVIDLPCGDFNWMSEIAGNFDSYIGLDVSKTCIKENKEKYPEYDFRVFDAITNKIPDCDLLIVRDMLGHMPLEFSTKAFNNISSSNWKYLISTNWLYVRDDGTLDEKKQKSHKNNNIGRFGLCFKVNLLNAPFNFQPPIEFMYDMRELNKTQCLWTKIIPEFK